MSPIDPELRLPGNGTFLAALEKCSGKTATVVGKPNPFCIEALLEDHSITRNQVVFIGDNLQTDIKFANQCKVDCVLVLTGVTMEANLESDLKHPDSGIPTYTLRNLKLGN